MTNTVGDAIALGERILSARVGSPVSLSHTECIESDSDAVLVRGITTDSPFLPSRKVVVKVFPDRGEERAGLLLREIVGYQFVGSLGTPDSFGPELIAYDFAERAFVLSDVGNTRTLQDLLNPRCTYCFNTGCITGLGSTYWCYASVYRWPRGRFPCLAASG